MPAAALGNSGPLTTAGGLIFRGAADGNVEAYDARTGDRLWQFQTGTPGGRGPAATYEVGGEQYVALTVGPEVWAFKLGGSLTPRPAPQVASGGLGPGGPVEDTGDIETAALVQTSVLTAGHRYAVDQYAFKPLRARVGVGAQVTFTNNGTVTHTLVARDGSWATPRLAPGEQVMLRFDRPGTHVYTCKEHPWSIGQIIVAASPPRAATGPAAGDVGSQVQRGRSAYGASCSVCHGDDLAGRDRNPALAGGAFLGRWQGRTVGDLFDKIRASMPPTAPGSQPGQEYADIVSYLLSANDSHVQTTRFVDDAGALRALVIK